MHEVKGNIFDKLDVADAICITTNGIIKNNGKAVCGKGIAKQAKDRWQEFDRLLGEKLNKFGNITNVIMKDEEVFVVALPTKNDWRDNSSIDLIEQSIQELVNITERNKWERVYLPRPGCSNGNLKWADVKLVLERYLDNRFYIIDKVELDYNVSDTEKFLPTTSGDYNFKKVPLDDPRVWALFGRGDTVGIFQLETRLGQDWSGKLKPFNIDEVAALVALIRPGPLESNQSDVYVNRKFGREDTVYTSPSLLPILENTQGVLVFQEQMMRICKELAGFSDVEAELARKACGKKLPEEMAKVKTMFMEGAAKTGVINEEQAQEIFGWIETSVRYSFNKSHGVGYGMTSYFCAYQKVHYPTEFYCSWLNFSHCKPEPKEEVYKLVQDAKLHGIDILPPDVQRGNVNFEITKERTVIFGLPYIRNVGQASVKTLKKVKDKLETWEGFFKSVPKIKRNVAESLVKSGACDCYKLSRNEMLKQLHIIYGYTHKDADNTNVTRPLSPKELGFFLDNIRENDGTPNSFKELLQTIIDTKVCVKKRIPVLEEKIEALEKLLQDTNKQKVIWEKIYLGLNLSCSAVDDIEIGEETSTCRDIFNALPKTKATLHAVVDKVRERLTSAKAKTPNRQYAYLSVSDNTGALDNLVCWPENYEKHKMSFQEGNVVTLSLYKDSWKDRTQLIVNKVELIG